MNAAKDPKVERIQTELERGIEDLRNDLVTKVANNPNFFGGGTLDVRIQDGSIVAVKHSIDTSRKPS